MPNLFVRQTSLTDVAGRLDYIGNPLRQEHLLATYDTASHLIDGQYWKVLAKECQLAFEQYGVKTRTVKSKDGKLIEQTLHCCEAKEIIFLIGNELLDRKTADDILQIACNAVSRKISRPVTGALHFNKSTSSLHIHIIYSERQLLAERCVKVAERNLFFDANGKRRYKKAEIMDENGRLLAGCKIAKKGEVFESHCFASVDKRMVDKKWLKDMKTNCFLQLRNGDLKGDVEITEYDPSTGMLPQQYIGNRVRNDVAVRLAEYNTTVREYNASVMLGLVSLEEALFVQKEVLGSDDKSKTLLWYIQQIRKRSIHQTLTPECKPELSSAIRSAEYRSSNNEYWKRYNTIRDETWQIFLAGQRAETKALQQSKKARYDLYLQHSYPVWDKQRKAVKRKMLKPKELEAYNYFEQRDELDKEIKQHKINLDVMRKYQEVAKGRQKIMQAMLLGGAEKEKIEAALHDYEEAMSLLRYYTSDPANNDYENRRLKVAQESLARARVRADAYLKKLDESKLQKESSLEVQVDQEYQSFKKGIMPIDDEMGIHDSDSIKDSMINHSVQHQEIGR